MNNLPVFFLFFLLGMAAFIVWLDWYKGRQRKKNKGDPVPMLLWCPQCNDRHIDEGEFATRVHHTHACQTCGHNWRPAVVPTIGVQFLPGFKTEKKDG